MDINVLGMVLCDGMKIDEIPEDIKSMFVETKINDGEIFILRSKKPIEYKDARFRFNIQFNNGIIERVCLIAASRQDNQEYLGCKELNEIHEKWLVNNYGEPTKRELFGFIYIMGKGKLCSEYDPRSGSSEIIYIMSQHKDAQ